jgi:hypothetical protein
VAEEIPKYVKFSGNTGLSDVSQVEIHTAELLVPEPSSFEVEVAIAKLKRHRSPSSDQIPAEFMQAGGDILRSQNHKKLNSVAFSPQANYTG